MVCNVVQLLVDFAIADQVYAKAKVPVTRTVNLWLGANVMLEYPLEEAKELLVSIIDSLVAVASQLGRHEDKFRAFLCL